MDSNSPCAEDDEIRNDFLGSGGGGLAVVYDNRSAAGTEFETDAGTDAARGVCDKGDFTAEAAMVGAGVVGRMAVLHY